MIERAKHLSDSKEHASLCQISRLQWHLGFAVSLLEADPFHGREGSIDMLLFAVGSISHLTGPEEPLQFFKQVAKLLQQAWASRIYQSKTISSLSCVSLPSLPNREHGLRWKRSRTLRVDCIRGRSTSSFLSRSRRSMDM